jgi:hypothetical protein
LFPNFLSPALYENIGNIPALTYLIGQYCIKTPDLVTSSIEPVLGVFQKLIASVKTDHDGITLICIILEKLPMASLNRFIVPIFQAIFTRLKVRGTDKFKGLVAVYLSHFARYPHVPFDRLSRMFHHSHVSCACWPLDVIVSMVL